MDAPKSIKDMTSAEYADWQIRCDLEHIKNLASEMLNQKTYYKGLVAVEINNFIAALNYIGEMADRLDHVAPVYWNREEDGCSYFHYQNELWSAPRYMDGNVDWHGAMPVEGYDEPLHPDIIFQIENILSTLEAESQG
jgi:hypothetical protein